MTESARCAAVKVLLLTTTCKIMNPKLFPKKWAKVDKLNLYFFFFFCSYINEWSLHPGYVAQKISKLTWLKIGDSLHWICHENYYDLFLWKKVGHGLDWIPVRCAIRKLMSKKIQLGSSSLSPEVFKWYVKVSLKFCQFMSHCTFTSPTCEFFFSLSPNYNFLLNGNSICGSPL